MPRLEWVRHPLGMGVFRRNELMRQLTSLPDWHPGRRPGCQPGNREPLATPERVSSSLTYRRPAPQAIQWREYFDVRIYLSGKGLRNHAAPDGVEHELRRAVHVELLQDVRAMRLDRRDTN